MAVFRPSLSYNMLQNRLNLIDFIFVFFGHKKGRNYLYHLLGNFTRISKMVLEFCLNLIFMDLWRHNDVMIFLISSIFKTFFQFFVLLLYLKVKMSYAIFLEIFRGFRKWYWIFAKIRFYWIYDVIMTSWLFWYIKFSSFYFNIWLIYPYWR